MGSQIRRISVWEAGLLQAKNSVYVKIELEDDRSKVELLPRKTMSDLAFKLNCQFDPQTESFRPFLGGTAGWVWEKTFKEAAHVEAV